VISPEHLMTRTAVLLQREQDGPVDEYGNPTWTEVGVPVACELQQESAYEDEGGVLQLTTWRLYLPASAPSSGWDALQLGSELYELEGDAWLARNPRTQLDSHVEARVRRLR